MRVVWEIPLYRGTVSFLSNNVGERETDERAVEHLLLTFTSERERETERRIQDFMLGTRDSERGLGIA